ncbi:MAG TPA: CpsB/CapC family capsule biosynthesis tyrosine phosphatase [Thermodesulfovibrionales bacterium]|nr:CpsB/CapC family capsule biosynthesis tyrosine phosphatase [Thermodesulfovibrionales bacterium]
MNYHDYHCHLLPGLDDGPKDLAESVDMASVLCSLGFTAVVCTPHLVKGTFENDVGKVQDAVATLQETLTKNKIVLTLHPSVEYRLDEHLLSLLDYSMPVRENVVLIELPRYLQPEKLLEFAYTIIQQKKLRPMIAHPERHTLFDDVSENGKLRDFLVTLSSGLKSLRTNLKSRDRDENRKDFLVERLHQMGCFFQGNIGSFAGIYGEQVRKRALRLLQMGFYDCLGTDAHCSHNLAVWLDEGMKVVARAIGEERLTSLLRPLEAPVS